MHSMKKLAPWLVLLACVAACPGSGSRTGPTGPETGPTSLTGPVTLSIVGTNDVHGAIDRLPVFAGFLANLRQRRADDGGVVLIDAGDMFQGTLESNMNEGEAVIDAYNQIGYNAVVVGNHEFDFGPVGPAVSPSEPSDDPRGALLARMAQARFPVLAANYLDASTGRRVDWPNAPATTSFTVAGVQVGVIGVSTLHTLEATLAANVSDLKMAPLADTITREARALRERGAQVVLVTAHAGGKCKNFDDPNDLSSCDSKEEIMQVAAALPSGLVDVIVAGHTHRAVAHRVNGIAIIESYSSMRAFGRVDLRVTPNGEQPASVEIAKIHRPRDICPGDRRLPVSKCQPGEYEGAPVVADQRVAGVIEPALEAAAARKQESLGVEIVGTFRRSYDTESALGNLLTDLTRTTRGTDVAVTNGGGLRADLPAGALTYGRLYELTPFDNRFATIEMTAADLSAALATNLQRDHGIFLVSGVRADARCVNNALIVDLLDERGVPIPPDRRLVITTSDYLATAESSPLARTGAGGPTIRIENDGTMRDAIAQVLRKRGGQIRADDPALTTPRLRYVGKRPVQCAAVQ